jgi:hypothetical protein
VAWSGPTCDVSGCRSDGLSRERALADLGQQRQPLPERHQMRPTYRRAGLRAQRRTRAIRFPTWRPHIPRRTAAGCRRRAAHCRHRCCLRRCLRAHHRRDDRGQLAGRVTAPRAAFLASSTRNSDPDHSNTHLEQFRLQRRDWCAGASSGLPGSRCRRVGNCVAQLSRTLDLSKRDVGSCLGEAIHPVRESPASDFLVGPRARHAHAIAG